MSALVFVFRSLIKSKLMPALVESEEEEEEEEDADIKDPLPEKLQSSMVTTERHARWFGCLGLSPGRWTH